MRPLLGVRRLVGAFAGRGLARPSSQPATAFGVKPPKAKAPTTGVPGAAAALGWRGGALQGGASALSMTCGTTGQHFLTLNVVFADQ